MTHTIFDERVRRMVEMTDKEYGDYKRSKFVPIDPIWTKTMTWVGLTSEPVITKLEENGNEHYYVITKTRAFTHRLFTALVADYCWYVRPTPTMKEELYQDALNHHLVAKIDEPMEGNVTADYTADRWFNRCKKEFIYNCKEWIDGYNFDTENDKILMFLDISNVKFTETSKFVRTDDYRNRGSKIFYSKLLEAAKVEEIPF